MSDTSSGAARATEQSFDSSLYSWCDRAIKDANNVRLTIDGEQLRVVGLTPNGLAKVEGIDGECRSERLTEPLTAELMPQLAHFKDRV